VKQIDPPQIDRDAQVSLSTRREFCSGACRVATLAGLAAFIPGCGGGGSPTGPSGNVSALTVVNATVSGGAATVTIDAGSPLAAVGGAALVQSSSGNFLVARTAQDTFAAFTAICTHQTCTITGFQNGLFVCPCHGSEFNTSGARVSGPAPRPLRQFTTSFANNVLTISA
jgi:nitrite reductase/ring-hydroxylating ferredoxin subunit